MGWTTPEYVEILKTYLQEYVSNKKQARALVLEKTVADLKAVANQKKVQLPPDITRVCAGISLCLHTDHAFITPQSVDTWFQNNRPQKQTRRSKSNRADGRASTTWTVHKLVKELMPDAIADIIAQDYPEHVSGTKEYFGIYPKCWSKAVKALSEEKTLELQELADKQNSEGVADSVKAKPVFPF